jgi:hypothetical protein
MNGSAIRAPPIPISTTAQSGRLVATLATVPINRPTPGEMRFHKPFATAPATNAEGEKYERL